MIYLYNTTKYNYQSISDYLESIAKEQGSIYHVLIMTGMDDIFEDAKQRTAIRGRLASTKEGASLLEAYAMTDDERDIFEKTIKNGAAEIFKKLSAWCKGIREAYRHNVSFGAPIFSGAIDSIAGAQVNDVSQAFTENSLAGYKLVITSPGTQMNVERTIISNAATGIILDSAFTSDVTGLEYSIFTDTDKYIIYYLELDTNWDINMLLGVEAAVKEALILHTIKEWYKANRFMDDFDIENTNYETELTKIRSQLIQSKVPYRRPTDMFS